MEQNNEEIESLANVFLSTSLRKEDEAFINLIIKIVTHFNFNPYGTVGLFDASTDNPVTLMKENIEKCDFVVLAATKRFFTKDAHSEKESTSLSEMVHTEAGMAFANSKPIVVFVEQGTNVGNFIPNVTQYITLDGTQDNLDSQYDLIASLMNNALQKVESKRRSDSWKDLGKIAIGSLAFIGGLFLLDRGGDDEGQ